MVTQTRGQESKLRRRTVAAINIQKEIDNLERRKDLLDKNGIINPLEASIFVFPHRFRAWLKERLESLEKQLSVLVERGVSL